MIGIPCDSYLNINDKGSYTKINQAYFVGGPKQAVEALNRNLDLQIQDYMTFNWKAVANAIDVLGGVDIELSKAEFFYINSFITETVKATGIGSLPADPRRHEPSGWCSGCSVRTTSTDGYRLCAYRASA